MMENEANDEGRYQEDAHTVSAIHIPPEELRHSLQRYFGINWDPGHIGETLAGQVVFAGIYDGYVASAFRVM